MNIFTKFWKWLTTPAIYKPTYFERLITNIARETLRGVNSSHCLGDPYEFDVMERYDNEIRIHARVMDGPALTGVFVVCFDEMLVKVYPLGFNANGIVTYELYMNW